jgi:hypothetical protein
MAHHWSSKIGERVTNAHGKKSDSVKAASEKRVAKSE